MLSKITFRTILFMAVLLLVLPMIMSARGTQESGNKIDITALDVNIQNILKAVENKDLTIAEAKVEVLELEKEFQINAQVRAEIFKMVEDIDAGIRNPEQCMDQLQIRDQNRDQLRTQDPEETPLKTQTKLQTSDKSK